MNKNFTNNNSKYTKLIAFTLAEVVLVMAIIGIVGVLAVTNARKDTDVAEKVAQLRKSYQIIESAFSAAVTDNGTIETWGSGNYPTSAEVWDVVSPYFKLEKNCGTNSGCWKDGKPYGLDGEETTYNINSSDIFEKAVLVSGVSISLTTNSLFDNHGDEIADIFVDVNGIKGLNIYGNDIFGFQVYNDGSVVPFNLAVGSGNKKPIDSSGTSCLQIGVYCTAWVLKFGNMDYLKDCADSLNWESKSTCK